MHGYETLEGFQLPKKIIITFWGNPFYDGRCINMINQLISQKYQIRVLGVGNQAEHLSYKGVDIDLIDQKILKNPITKYSKYFKYVKHYIKTHRPNIVIASDLYSMIPVAKIKKIINIKVIYDSRELYTKMAGLINRPILQKIWSWYEKIYILDTDYILVTADIDKEYLKKLYNHPKIELIQNLPGQSFIDYQQVSLKEILCLNEEQKIFLYQGKFHKGRGIQFSIKCLSQIPQAVLVLIGDGPMKSQYLKTAKQYNMEERIFFIDAVPYEELASFSKDAFIGLSIIQPISKSYAHALPNKLFEYAVSGLPVICSNLTAMESMINQYKSGLTIKHDSEDQFIQAYEKISENYQNYLLDEPTKSKLLWNNKNEGLNEIINE